MTATELLRHAIHRLEGDQDIRSALDLLDRLAAQLEATGNTNAGRDIRRIRASVDDDRWRAYADLCAIEHELANASIPDSIPD